MKTTLKKKKEGKKKSDYIFIVFYMIIGFSCGFGTISFLEDAANELSFGMYILFLLFLIAELYVCMLIQIIIHEAGHLVFGFISGYKFSSFRIANLMWIKENGKIRFKRFSMLGTAGQCLMSPPDMKDGKIPFVLYNLGGSLMNLLTVPVFLPLYFITKDTPLLSSLFFILSIIGAAYSLMNGLPFKLGTVNNDGCNALEMSKSPDALYSLWLQMKLSDEMQRGVRLKDLPSDWFRLSKDSDINNSMVATIAVFYDNYLLDCHRFEEARELADDLINGDNGVLGLHKNLLKCDLLYMELILNKEPYNDKFLTEQEKFIKQMQNTLSFIRTEYAYALLFEHDTEKAQKLKERFEKCAKKHPYKSEVESEQELIEIALDLSICNT